MACFGFTMSSSFIQGKGSILTKMVDGLPRLALDFRFHSGEGQYSNQDGRWSTKAGTWLQISYLDCNYFNLLQERKCGVLHERRAHWASAEEWADTLLICAGGSLRVPGTKQIDRLSTRHSHQFARLFSSSLLTFFHKKN